MTLSRGKYYCAISPLIKIPQFIMFHIVPCAARAGCSVRLSWKKKIKKWRSGQEVMPLCLQMSIWGSECLSKFQSRDSIAMQEDNSSCPHEKDEYTALCGKGTSVNKQENHLTVSFANIKNNREYRRK